MLEKADLDSSGGVDFIDFALFASYWQNDCIAPDSCGPANLDGLAPVDWPDLSIFVDSWLWGK
ncbi:MAG: hypothetical protein ACYS76_15360 [Planctomycetota bacterium]